MSKQLLSNGDDHPEAARKNLADAEVLFAAARHDGAAYLSGYVVECALKAVLVFELGPNHMTVKKLKALMHNINKISTRALHLAALPSSKTARYSPKVTAGHSMYDATTGWKETIRYRPPGAVSEATANEWVEEANGIYKSTIVPMRLDGVI